jgi:hypothetical protein
MVIGNLVAKRGLMILGWMFDSKLLKKPEAFEGEGASKLCR